MISSGPQPQQDAPAAVLRATAGPHADTRLQIILLQDELARTPADADDDLLRLHHVLAANHDTLGEYHPALHHANQELPLRRHIQGDHHPDTLLTRGNIAFLTGECGDPAGALHLFRELLPNAMRVLGPDHSESLLTRGNIAHLTGECGDPAEGLHLLRELLPDRIRVLGPDHPDTLATRNNIAYWTGECGDPAGALRLAQDLLPDQVRGLGPGHPYTLATRNNIASWTERLSASTPRPEGTIEAEAPGNTGAQAESGR